MALTLMATLKKQIALNQNYLVISYLRKKDKKETSETEKSPDVVNKEAIA